MAEWYDIAEHAFEAIVGWVYEYYRGYFAR